MVLREMATPNMKPKRLRQNIWSENGTHFHLRLCRAADCMVFSLASGRAQVGFAFPVSKGYAAYFAFESMGSGGCLVGI